jgi:hypothetical protein
VDWQSGQRKSPPGEPAGFFKYEAYGKGELEAFALQALALHLPRPAHRFGGFPRATLRRLLEMATQLHFTENTFPLHLLLERLERLINIVVTNENLHWVACSITGLL